MATELAERRPKATNGNVINCLYFFTFRFVVNASDANLSFVGQCNPLSMQLIADNQCHVMTELNLVGV